MNFADIEDQYAGYDHAAVLLQSIPYDGTSTWGKGADQNFQAFMDAAYNLEWYDIETDSEVYLRGIHVLPAIEESSSPEIVYQTVFTRTQELIKTKKFLTFLGGEHSISMGVIKAFYQAYPDITILQIDAHADLRPSYEGSPYNHACTVYEASRNANLIQVGIRSMDLSEKKQMDLDRCYFAHTMQGNDTWMDASIAQMSKRVYITFDLDAFDPAIMPGTGTPEPGGLDWYTTLTYLQKVFSKREVLGFDLVELAPIEGQRASQFLAAKLYYKMLSYKFEIQNCDGSKQLHHHSTQK
ncbi:MAG: agmatinase [Kiritimatiellae bacterium]|nr:agmatinase [Kiritimatiellia bacterium]